MKNQFSKIFLTLLVCAFLSAGLIDSAGAQTPIVTPTSLPGTALPVPPQVPSLQTDVFQLENPDVIPFSLLRQSEIQLNGPYDSAGVSFSIPADWALKEGVQLQARVGVSFNTGVQSQANVTIINGGTLTILLNGRVLTVAPLNEVGETAINLNIPLTAFANAPADGRMFLRFILESGTSCRVIGSDMTVFIHSTSYLNFPHDLIHPSTSLVNFPRPIIQNSIFPDSALLVIPDQPTASELQAALTVAAGLGNLSSSRLVLDMTTLSKLSEDLNKQNLIFIGKAGSFPLLKELKLPLAPATGGQFQFSSGGQDDGLIEMVNSPWSSPHVVLVVSANTDAGVVKAAQALSSGIIRPNQFENLSIIDKVNTLPISGQQVVDQTLSDLGFEIQSFQGRGEGIADYNFNIPLGMALGNEAYFDMVYGHSSLLDFTNSQIIVLLNGQPIGSVRMSDTTASLPTNHIKILIPPSAALQGVNRLSVAVTLEPVDNCTPPDSQGLWVNIWPESLIHTPLMSTPLTPGVAQDLSVYPTPFTFTPTLANTAFVLEHDNLDSWRNAMKIAAFLGDGANGSLYQLSAFYGDAVPETERSKYHLLVIGSPSRMPIVGEMNNDLPAPFLNGTDIASENENFQVTYRIPSDSPMGYIQMLPSPWNSNNVVLGILGNTTQGSTWAAAALLDPVLRNQLRGNFAVVNNNQIISSDTRYVAPGSGDSTNVQLPEVITNPPGGSGADLPKTGLQWILPVLIGSLVLIAVLVVIALIQNRAHSIRKMSKKVPGKDNGDDSQK